MPKTYEYATLDSVVEALNQGERIDSSDVRPSLRSAMVHVGYYGMRGCYMPEESSHFYARNRREIVEAHCETCRHFDDSERVPQGFRASLMRGGSAYTRDGRTSFEVDVVTVSDLLRD
jgi:hypothetical protein